MASAIDANEAAFTTVRESVAVLQFTEAGFDCSRGVRGENGLFRAQIQAQLRPASRGKQLKQWREQILAVVVVGAQKAAVKVQTRIANKVKRTASGRDKDSVKDALRAMLHAVNRRGLGRYRRRFEPSGSVRKDPSRQTSYRVSFLPFEIHQCSDHRTDLREAQAEMGCTLSESQRTKKNTLRFF